MENEKSIFAKAMRSEAVEEAVLGQVTMNLIFSTRKLFGLTRVSHLTS